MASNTAEFGIIGLGPRGLSVMERLCANAAQFLGPDGSLVLHLIDPHLGAGGQVWRSDQSGELLMNTVASQVTMFLDESVDCDGPILHGPSLHEWARFNALIGPLEHLPDHLYEEACRLGPDDYPSRAFYGRYLTWVLHHLIDTAPPGVRVVVHEKQAIDLTETPDGRQVVTLAGGAEVSGLDSVVLAQGHTANRLTGTEALLAKHAEDHDLFYQAPGNPADADLDAIEPGRPTVLRGMGLNFFDHLALLTTGRGGRFERTWSGRLRYRPSGREPRLIAGSRRGIPHHARGENQKGAHGRHEPVFFTSAVVAELQARAEAGAPVDFTRDVWPVIDREVRGVYYAQLITARLCACDAEVFLRHFVALNTDGDILPRQRRSVESLSDTTSAQEDALLERFGVGPEDRWSWSRISRPYGDRQFSGQPEFRAWLLSYLEQDVAQAKQGNVSGPLKAALDVLRDLRNEIRLVVDHGGLSGDSYHDDLQRWYTPFNAFLSIGPPVHRIEQLIALIEGGVLEVLGPGLRVWAADDGYRASSLIPGSERTVTALIEARLPEHDLRHTADPLIRRMLARGDCCLHRIPIRDGGFYETGGLAVTRKPYHLLTAQRQPHPRRFALGVPTETVHWVTAAGIRPGVNSVILGDADGIARAGLRAALEQPAVARS